MEEQEFKKELIRLIKKYRDQEISSARFVNDSQELAHKASLSGLGQLNDFKDKNLGWAKYWIEEISYYGFEDVTQHHFDFIKFLDNIS